MLEKIKNNKEILYLVILMVVPISVLFAAAAASKTDLQNFVNNQNKPAEDEIGIIDTFSSVDIKGKAAVVKDLQTGEILYSKNSDLPLPLASITKVLTTLTVAINSNDNVVGISIDDFNTEGNSGIFPGEQFYRKDLINLTLISSSNDGASALAASTFNISADPKSDFIKEMNRLAREIGMDNSYFYNETGLDNDLQTAGAHGSAEDVALLFEYVIENYPEIIEFTKEETLYVKSLNGLVHPAKNTNEIVGTLPNTLASKTGYTDIAGGNLAVVIDPFLNRPFAVVVLGSTEEDRFKDVEKLSERIIEFFKVNSDALTSDGTESEDKTN
jgi:D-alanyl-D-alanine carboxypeptidase (penicillin-binding protein 5/6)